MGNRDKPTKEAKKPPSKKVKPTPSVFNKEGLLNYTPDYLANFDAHQTTDCAKLSIAMQQIIKDAYRIFSSYSVPASFSVCTLCCVSVAEEKALRTIPLARLPKQLIYAYNDSAKPSHCNKSEVAYLLPRILELIALNEDIMHSPELNLTWFAKVPYELWPNEERQILDKFALQYLIDQLSQAEQQQRILYFEEILIMFGRTGISLTPLLTYLMQTDNFYIIASIAYLVASADTPSRLITDCFADEHPHINTLFCQYLDDHLDLLKQHAEHAILAPQPIITNSEYVSYQIELGLCYLSDQ